MKQVLFALALVGAVLTMWLRASGPAAGVRPVAAKTGHEPQLPGGRVVISMLYSPEKQPWIEWAQDQYVREHPEVQVKLTSMGPVLAVDAILRGQEKPVVWSPESILELGDVAERWQKQTGRPLYGADPKYAPESLLKTALVMIAWQSRAKVIDEYVRRREGNNPKLWKRLIEATASHEGWKGLDGPAEWGAVKFGYTDPILTGGGLWTMFLACLDELDADHLALQKIDDPHVVELLRTAAASPLMPPATAKEIVKRMEQFGPSQYDIVVTYETLALEAIKIPKERWERLVIYYPPALVWSDHPAVVLQLDGISEEQKKAGLQWIRYLKSRAAQLKAISYGFRPADESIPLYSNPDDNPFLAVSLRMGERLKIEKVISPPPGEVVEKLLQTLRNVYGRL